MKIRLATADEAEHLWSIRNQAIRHGCTTSFDAKTISAWTPDEMPVSYICIVKNNPFFVAVNKNDDPIATGYLNLEADSVEAIFTLPQYTGCGAAGLILDAIKAEAKKRNIKKLVLDSSPNAERFYQKHGFISIKNGSYYSSLAQAELNCIRMEIEL
ncbi:MULTISPECIES: GNAT family N-acetyltransferase [Providencia]|uniref:GNAT family N-acetyltransferase n=1 Tax=Providencia huaxiensis TaxID=2027290 RepID=A0A8I2AHB5_9GAMM|nr:MULTISPECIES: GNAT family N-acetyltransferase [Providencia]MBN6360185.1 GNAT family N-acetyltransferase [Providencia huaxiensis]MBQ0267287.1 GNAT family N-acetyltransferase [Providencia huaxiensis]MBQ0535321.1 GNAT family N-acetyltransferase [Providencia huaxiensis]MBQ0590407.1 GNAT family N-acetyltransferase [Providencia huaxiensis]MCG9536699.1 GNAT family N-acetyltransferase [Providencia huaxiensis]